MNTAFNSALKQSTSIRKDLSALVSPTFTDASSPSQPSPSSLTPAALGSLSASLTAFARTLDEYNTLAKQELNPAKQEKAFERIRNFRSELHDYRQQFDGLKAARDEVVQTQNRAELLGRRPFVTSTPENPYANATATSAASSSGYGISTGGMGHARSGSGGGVGGGGGGGDITREGHLMREQNFFASTNSALDEYIARGQAVLGDLGNQRETLKGAQKRLYDVAGTLGLSGNTIRMIERRAKQDKWIFGAGVVVFFVFCWLVLHYLR
ncbi:Protein transport protein BOS1 [Coniochaeta hoffmannii]|uniref:Protein transport protein BOS1 n=1 Tax=Coniochaeta hoffmannii TaxID=91930 RepID=A0AA38VNE1_9PEZI|nr:Protein transport protein BOS1 [Coniochaeta hoffmannii]